MAVEDWQGSTCLLEYRDPASNSDKFYRISILWNDLNNDARVVFQYGRNGTNGQASFKMCGSRIAAEQIANRRFDQKRNKGYIIADLWTPIGVDSSAMRHYLQLAGVNTNGGPVEVVQDGEGVTFDEMGTLVQNLLTKAVQKDQNDTVDVMVEAATVNAKFAQLREQFENIESEVEFVNTAVRSRL